MAGGIARLRGGKEINRRERKGRRDYFRLSFEFFSAFSANSAVNYYVSLSIRIADFQANAGAENLNLLLLK